MDSGYRHPVHDVAVDTLRIFAMNVNGGDFVVELTE